MGNLHNLDIQLQPVAQQLFGIVANTHFVDGGSAEDSRRSKVFHGQALTLTNLSNKSCAVIGSRESAADMDIIKWGFGHAEGNVEHCQVRNLDGFVTKVGQVSFQFCIRNSRRFNFIVQPEGIACAVSGTTLVSNFSMLPVSCISSGMRGLRRNVRETPCSQPFST